MPTPLKILIIDDDQDDQEFLLEAIQELYPYSSHVSANDGAEALEYIDKNPPPPTLIFLDLNMPLVNGFEFLTLYQKKPEYKYSRVIIYSTSSHPRDKKKSRELGAAEFITKVSDLDILKEKILQVVDRVL